MSKIVTFEQAKRLKELGYEYDIHQVYFIHNNSKDITRQAVGVEEIFLDEFKDNYSPIPTTASALDWIREEKGIMLAVELESKLSRLGEIIGYEYGGAYIYDKGKDVWLPTHPTHPLAESALLDAVLTYLENK